MNRPGAFSFVKHFFRVVFLGGLLAMGLPGLALAATCAPAATQGTAPADFKAYCWLDFSGYNDTTARSSTGQPLSFNLPDGSVLNMTLKTTNVAGPSSPALTAVAVPSWRGAAFGNAAFGGIPGRPVLYTTEAYGYGSTNQVVLSGISVTAPSGGVVYYSIVVADAESTDAGESLSFVTNGRAWEQVARIQNGSSPAYPAVTGVGTTTVTETGTSGTPGSFVFRSANPPQITATIQAVGRQGIIVGLRHASVSVVSQIANARYNAADQFSYAVKTTGGATLTSGATSGTATSGFTPAFAPTVVAPFVVSQAMAGGSTGTLANYTTSLTCVNANTSSTTVLPVNQPVSSYQISNLLRYGDSVSCTFTNTPIFQVNGFVYNDANHNANLDGGETGSGVTGLYVKLTTSSGGICQSPATAAAAVTAGTGAYSLPGLAQGDYCLILNGNNTLSDITAAAPAGWIGTQNPSGVIQLSVGGAPPAPQNFGLYKGSRLSGTVFADTGVGSGTANNGGKDGSEPGLAAVTVNASAGATAVASASTSSDGSYTLWMPFGTSGTVTITPAAPSGYLATGGSAGTTGGSYSRPSVSFSFGAGQSYSGVNFGLVPPSTLGPNRAQTAAPGTTVFYAHTFQAGSGGQVSFALANAATPSSPAWSQVLYQDSNCDGVRAAGEPQVTAPVTVTAGQKLCLIVKQFVPAGAALGAQNTVTLGASFSYTGASPALSSSLSATDITTVGQPGALALSKLVSNATQSLSAATAVSANPGDTLEYSLSALNNGSQALSTLLVNDATPAFTTHVSAACPGTLPSGITGCSVSAQPAVGAKGGLQWTFTGSLASGAQLVVTYRVKVDQ